MVGANYEHDKAEVLNIEFSDLSSSYLIDPPFHDALNISNRNVKTYSVFANGFYRLTPTLTLNGGIRYTKANSDFAACTGSRDTLADLLGGTRATYPDNPNLDGQCYTYLSDFSQGPFYRPKLREDNFPWRVGLEWKAAPDTLLYAVVSKGYKAGSIVTTGAAQYKTLEPAVQESVQAYEIGYKGRLLDRRLDVTLAAFHYDYKNKQMIGRVVDAVFGPLPSLVNVPQSKVDGAEASLVWRDRGFTLDASATYIDSEVTESFLNYDPYGNTFDFKGEAFPFTPKWSLQGGVRYDWEVDADLSAFIGIRGSYQSKAVSAFGNNSAIDSGAPSLANKAYGLLDLSAGIKSESGNWRAEIWGRNITNTYYWSAANYGADTVTRFAGMPATYGITVGFEY